MDHLVAGTVGTGAGLVSWSPIAFIHNYYTTTQILGYPCSHSLILIFVFLLLPYPILSLPSVGSSNGRCKNNQLRDAGETSHVHFN
jgi:hypothetical protein